MTGIKKALHASVFALGASLSFPAPSAAFFGPTCIPTLYNCFCTFRIPCPVLDPVQNAREQLKNGAFKDITTHWEVLKNPQDALLRAAQGQGSLTVPGFGGVGIDLGALSGGLPNLGLPSSFDLSAFQKIASGKMQFGDFMSMAGAAGLDANKLAEYGITPASLGALASGKLSAKDMVGLVAGTAITGKMSAINSNLNGLGINADMIASLAGGKLTAADFIKVASNAGVDLSKLQAAGLSTDVLERISKGISPDQILSLTKSLNLQGGYLSSIGITEKLITDVATGVAEPSRLLDIASNAGLDMSSLAAVGLDANTIKTLGKGTGGAALMSVLQKAGFDSSPISALGMDASIIGGIASGALSKEAIRTLAAAAGLNPSAIIIPGIDGPMSLPGVRPSDASNMITIPMSEIPGLSAIMQQARAPAAGSGIPTQGAAACAGDKTLISVSAYPNEFGDDPANIDMAISGGNLGTYAESVSDATAASTDTMIFGLSRSMTAQPLVLAALESIDQFTKLMDEAQTAQDDIIVNDMIKTHLMTARAEVSSMMTAYASTISASRINGMYVTPVPILPYDSRWQEAIDAMPKSVSKIQKEKAEELRKASSDHTAFMHAAQEALLAHNILIDAAETRASLPDVVNTILIHDRHKEMQVLLEAEILKALLILYGQDDYEKAWSILLPQLLASPGHYHDEGKYSVSRRKADDMATVLTAQQEKTAYGTRQRDSGGTRTGKSINHGDSGGYQQDEWEFTRLTKLQPSFGFLSSYEGPFDEKYDIDSASSSFGNNDGRVNHDDAQKMSRIIQFYLELLRRTNYAGEMRRGEPHLAITGEFWEELVINAPQCLASPIPLNAKNLAARPDLFDLSHTCTHLTWTDGDREDYISPSELGGADAALWAAKIELDRTQLRTGGAEGAARAAAKAIAILESTKVTDRLDRLGHGGAAEHLRRISSELKGIATGTSGGKRVSFPKE